MATANLVPNAAGNANECYKTGGQAGSATNYTLIDDPVGTPDEGTTVVKSHWTDDIWYTDLYNIPTVTVGVINALTVRVRVEASAVPDRTSMEILIRTGGTTFASGELTVTDSFVDRNYEWADNPDTSSAWTQAELDDVEIGVILRRPTGGVTHTDVTQVYLEVDYAVSVPVADGDLIGIPVIRKS